jgi:hypothetical protein
MTRADSPAVDTLYGHPSRTSATHVQTIGIRRVVAEEFRRLQRGDQLGRQHGGSTEPMADGAAHDAALHVAPAFVGWESRRR